MIPYQWVSTVVGLLLAATIILLVRRNHLHARNAIWWILVAVLMAAIGVFPGSVDWIAAKLGVAYPPTLVMLVGMALILLRLLKSDIERSRGQQDLRILAQKLALLEAELRTKRKDKTRTE